MITRRTRRMQYHLAWSREEIFPAFHLSMFFSFSILCWLKPTIWAVYYRLSPKQSFNALWLGAYPSCFWPNYLYSFLDNIIGLDKKLWRCMMENLLTPALMKLFVVCWPCALESELLIFIIRMLRGLKYHDFLLHHSFCRSLSQ